MNKHLATLALTIGLVAFAGPAISHADTTIHTDPCFDGHSTTVITASPCTPSTPSMSFICANGYAHMVQAVDYCPAPKVVTIGEAELGTQYVPRIFAPTRLDVAMRRTSLQSMRFRCARLGGSRLVASHGLYVCRGVDV